MARIRVPPNLPELARTAFARAKASGDVNFYPTQAAVIDVDSIPFQLRFAPSLANKPKKPPRTTTATPSSAAPPFDPFADPPEALVVARLDPPTHYLVLNKFAIVPEHLILATAAFAPQTHLLAAADLAAARACVEAYAGEGEGVYVFYNSGEHSGMSQPHRHLQLLPVGRMREGIEGQGEWGVLAERLAIGEGRLPVRCFVERLDGEGYTSAHDPDGNRLRGVYLRLYRKACVSMDVDAGDAEGEARISYNLGVTRDVMVLLPRRAEGGELLGEDGRVVGSLALNGTVLAGTALVKAREEWDALRRDPGQLGRVLGKI